MNNRNPIKHIKFSENDYFQPPVHGGSSSAPHKPVTSEFRQELVASIDEVSSALDGKLRDGDVAAVVVELEDKATAKSNRPTSIFSGDTCPFFGDIGYAKFLVKVSASGLKSLKKKVERASSKADTKELSAIKSISLFKPNIKITDEGGAVSIRLFRFNSVAENQDLDKKFESYLNSLNCKWTKHPSDVVRLYRVTENTLNLEVSVGEFVGVQSVISSKCIKIRPLVRSTLATEPVSIHPPSPFVEYPTVAVVDSGVSLNCLPLSPWVVGRETYVAPEFKNDDHGTFVSGLISNGFHLNGEDPRFPMCQAKVFSIEVLGDDAGDMFEIVEAMHSIAKQNPQIKVWNLSLGADCPVSMDEISPMALMLDEFQDKFDCLCVVAAGNYEGGFREWPPSAVLEDGISSPGDSVRSLTVGSVAHVDGLVKDGEPSHFSRKGPVSNYVQKPEVVHYGGNIMMNGGRPVILGVNSIDIDGAARHDIGTSFSTPIISAIAANLFHKIGDKATPSLVKALIIHSANLQHQIGSEYKPYYGWGKPEESDQILSVQDYESTMVFEGLAQKSFEIEKLPFPIPRCLRTEDQKVRAEFFITLVYQPELDPNRAFEYCQMDLQVGFGKIDAAGKFTSKVPLQTGSHQYESDMVKSGDKWSPVKVYYAKFPQGVNIESWRLRVAVLDREGYEATGVLVPFSLILTVRDIDKQQPVYNEMAQLMDAHNWEVSDLVVDTQIRV